MYDLKQIIQKYELNAKKSLGQNFLIDDLVLDKIIFNADIQNGDLVYVKAAQTQNFNSIVEELKKKYELK